MRHLVAFARQLGFLLMLSVWMHPGLAPSLLRADDDLRVLEEQAIRAAVERVAPSVVRIETFGGLERVDGRVVGIGPTTGLVVSSEGHIISSAFNFIQKPTSILVTLHGGQRAAAEIVARDQSRMLVLLKANVDQPLAVPIPAPAESMRTGQWTIAVGRTFSLEEPNVSVGVMSATNRIWGRAVQTDAKISPSNYGGPLIDIQGRVLGILVPLSPQAQQEVAGTEWYDSGIGFAVPLTDVLARLEPLKAGEDQFPGLLGISLAGSNEMVDDAIIAVVRVKSPGELAGAVVGDKIVSAAGEPITRVAQLKHVLGRLYAGDELTFQVERDDQLLDLTATLVAELLPYEHPFLGILPERGMAAVGPAEVVAAAAIPEADAAEEEDEEANAGARPAVGIMVRYVYPSSPADEAGVLAGDLLTRLNGEPLEDQETAERLLAQHEPGDMVRLGWSRGEESFERDVTLSSLPSEIPNQLPELASQQQEWEGDRPAVGKIPIKIPEEPNDCFAWVPDNYRPDRTAGVVVWLHPAGEYDFDELAAAWKTHCEENQLILLAPKSAHATGWQPTELGFLRRAMEHLFDQYAVDRHRVVAHGAQVGGAMAYLAGFSHRELIRGVAPVEAALPGRLRIPDNDPLQRFAVFSAVPVGSRSFPAVQAGLEALRERKYPVHAMELPEGAKTLQAEQRETLIRWIDTLDRL